MHKEIADRWADKLESGELPQGRGRLFQDSDKRNAKGENIGGYCCLGVLCEIAVEDGIIEKRVYDPIDRSVGYGTYEEFNNGEQGTAFPPLSVVEWAGLEDENPVFKTPGETCALGCCNRNLAAATLNDDRKYTFEQIAALIREQYDKI